MYRWFHICAISIYLSIYIDFMVNYILGPYSLHHILIWSIHNFSIMLIWSLTFQCCVNLVIVVISSMEIANVANGQNKKLISIDMKIN